MNNLQMELVKMNVNNYIASIDDYLSGHLFSTHIGDCQSRLELCNQIYKYEYIQYFNERIEFLNYTVEMPRGDFSYLCLEGFDMNRNYILFKDNENEFFHLKILIEAVIAKSTDSDKVSFDHNILDRVQILDGSGRFKTIYDNWRNIFEQSFQMEIFKKEWSLIWESLNLLQNDISDPTRPWLKNYALEQLGMSWDVISTKITNNTLNHDPSKIHLAGNHLFEKIGNIDFTK